MAPTTPAAPPARLAGLDGIRGLAALFVVLHHTYLRSFPGYPASTGPWWAGWLIYGHLAVGVFMVLSGFSLALSPARTGWRVAVRRFLRRRAWRILPPYWAALVFSLLVAWLIVPQPGEARPDTASVVVNGLLLQDIVDPPTPNRAFWTIAIEAQLYLVFPVLLLLIRRLNAAAMVAAVTVVVVTIHLLAGDVPLVERLTLQFAVLFALGIAAASVSFAALRWLALATAVPVFAVIAWNGPVWTIGQQLFWIDVALGPAVAGLLAAVAAGRPRALVRLLDARPVRRLGEISYSLYLTHAPIVVVVYDFLVAGWVPRGVPSFLVSVAIVVPVTIAFARLFATAFELPFQRYRGWAALTGRPRDTTPA